MRLVSSAVEHATSSAGGESPSPVDPIQRLLEEAGRVTDELATLGDSLAAQSDVAKREAQKLIDAIGEATARIEALAGERENESTSPAGRPGSSDGARLLATQLMVNGSSREEAETQLRSEFGIEHATEMLDQVFASQQDRP